MKSINLSTFKLQFEELQDNNISCDFNTYKNFSTKCRFIDKEYGDWWTTPKNIVRLKVKHLNRRALEFIKRRKIPLETIKERIKNKHGNQIVLLDETYIGTNAKATFVDIEYGKFTANIHQILSGTKCIKRSNKETSDRLVLKENQVKLKLPDHIKLDFLTYTRINSKCKFIDQKYGEFWAIPNNVLNKGSGHPVRGKEKAIATCLKNYGTTHPNKNFEQFKIGARNRWLTTILVHWKTKEELIVMSSFEFAIVNYLNINNIDFDWQIPFILPNGQTYIIDLYLKQENLYVEIKGAFLNEKSKIKYYLFSSIHKNSELWQTNKIKELTGLSEYKIRKNFQQFLRK